LDRRDIAAVYFPSGTRVPLLFFAGAPLGMLAFEEAFMPYMLTSDGRTLAEPIKETNLLPAPEAPKVVQLLGAA
jgi:hypothetical protein